MTRAHLFVLALLTISISTAVRAAEVYFPPTTGAWETVEPDAVGWNSMLIDEALEIAGQRNSSGVLILHNGRIMAERYWDGPENAAYRNVLTGFDAAGHAIEDVASAQKSVVAVLTGMAQERGYLSIEDSVSQYLGQGWSRASATQESAITIRHLLSMTSGLAEDFTFEAAPGTKWFYNTPVYHTTMRVLIAATGLERNPLTVGWISEPLGMVNTSWTPRPWADAAIATGLSTTARELARFGLMIQSDGKWGDDTIIADSAFLETMLSPSQTVNPAYGYLWWLNGQEFSLAPGTAAARTDGQLIPAAPSDLVAMMGAGDRKLYLVPSLGLIVTRLGYTGGMPDSSFNNAFWEALMRASPSR